jgi:diguanylate cyclase (GGDEF)-like protein
VKWIQQEQAEALLQPPELLLQEIGSFQESIAFGPPMSSALFSGGKTRGILMVFPQESSFSPEDAKLLGFLANEASVVLELARLYHRLETEASTDGLTGLYNYRYFMDALHREVKRASRFQEPFAVVMVDVDNLKEYNDANGHLAGSSALREMGSLLKTDAREIDIIAKYGGDEFSLILPNTNAAGSIVFAERMLRRVSGHQFQDDPQRRLTISAGIAVYPGDGDSARELLSRADDRLYLAKSEGRNRIGFPVPPTVLSAPAPED